ncbi:MAG: GNAT family N-acetyltransferase [Eubacteriales bacterium]|nr:GNAT family N-acetyltransferase [Eubacteriales bacterium]MDD3882363.1 GNAT family N-acetyltransferase [Eubacteriales bacterium]MDD4512416.1 GNAT family N-acetyltransferase [Eubacteriales bacterium]
MQRAFGVFARFPVLRGRLVSLRQLTIKDADDVFEYSSDPVVAETVLWSPHKHIAETRAYLRYVLRQYRQNEPCSLAIAENSTGKVVGTMSVMWVDEDNASAEIGYSLSRDYWNRGYMTEAVSLILAFLFDELGLNRVEAQHQTDNPASGRVMRKNGMVREGMMRQRIFNKTRFVDVEAYAILYEDYCRQKGKPIERRYPLGGMYRM